MDKIAERVFALKRADLRKLREYGFKENEAGEFCLSCDIADEILRLGDELLGGKERSKNDDAHANADGGDD